MLVPQQRGAVRHSCFVGISRCETLALQAIGAPGFRPAPRSAERSEANLSHGAIPAGDGAAVRGQGVMPGGSPALRVVSVLAGISPQGRRIAQHAKKQMAANLSHGAIPAGDGAAVRGQGVMPGGSPALRGAERSEASLSHGAIPAGDGAAVRGQGVMPGGSPALRVVSVLAGISLKGGALPSTRKNKWQRTFGSLPAISGESVKGGYPLSQSVTTNRNSPPRAASGAQGSFDC